MAQQIPSSADIAAAFEDALRESIDPSGTGAVNLRAGSDNAALVSMATQLGNRVFAYVADRVRARSIADSTDSDLDQLIQDIYNDNRKQSSASHTTVYLHRSGTAATSIPKGTRFSSRAQGTMAALQFESSALVSVGSGVLVVAVPVTCRTPGSVGNIAQSAIVDIVDALADNTWSIYTPAAGDPVLGGGSIDVVAGGADREKDDEVKARLNQINLDASRQRATKAAVEYGAKLVAGVVHATVVETGYGSLIVYVGDANYTASSALIDAVETEIDNWRAYGVPATVYSYAAQLVNVSITLYMARDLVNYSRADLEAAARTAIKRYFDFLPRPDEYYTEAIVAAAFGAHAEVQHAVLASPASSVVRPGDSGYGLITALNRYYVTDGSITVTVLGPYHG